MGPWCYSLSLSSKEILLFYIRYLIELKRLDSIRHHRPPREGFWTRLSEGNGKDLVIVGQVGEHVSFLWYFVLRSYQSWLK